MSSGGGYDWKVFIYCQGLRLLPPSLIRLSSDCCPVLCSLLLKLPYPPFTPPPPPLLLTAVGPLRMYRESLAGLALAATIEELSGSIALTEAQKESMWVVLDRTMEKCLAEAPVMSQVRVTCPPPSLYDLLPPVPERSQAVHITDDQGAEGDEAAPTVQMVPDVSADCDIAFPVYRLVGDMWTILLKNPTVEVRDEFGAEEKFQLDYLKVYLKDTVASATGGTREPKLKRARR